MPRVIQNLQDRALRVDTLVKMSNPPEHLSGRTLFPGALLALLVTAGALFALAVVIAVNGDGPAKLWLDGGGSTVNLQATGGTSAPAGGFGAPSSPVALLTDAPTTGRGAAITLPAPSAAQRRALVRLRSNAQVRRRAARTPAASHPAKPTPAATTTPGQVLSRPAASTTPAPVASPAPGSTVVKSRGRGTSPDKAEVPRQRVRSDATPAPTPAPTSSGTPAPPPRSDSAPATEMRTYHPQPTTGVGAADGVLTRVHPGG
jgi:hypothetical protein